MTKSIPFGGIDLDPIELGINGNAILGIKESGKSYLGTQLGEIFFDTGIPFITFDPIGLWHNMRYPGRGKGYPIVVAGGLHGDIPLTPESAPAIVEAAMKNRVSLVLDLFHPDLTKAAWRKIVHDCALLLLHRNSQYGLRHIFIEEAAEFVPQRPTDWKVYEAVERVIRMGGNSRLGCTLISPRSQEVNKAVLELCENMFLFRQRGKNALENLKKWLDVAGATGGAVMKSLPSMPRGECWAWMGGADTPVHVKVPEKSSFHPNRRDQHGEGSQPAKKAVDLGKFLTALQTTLKEIDGAKNGSESPKDMVAPEISKSEREQLARLGIAVQTLEMKLTERNATIGKLIREVERYEGAVLAVRGISCSDALRGPVSDALAHDRVELGGNSIGREAVIEQLIRDLTMKGVTLASGVKFVTPETSREAAASIGQRTTRFKVETTPGSNPTKILPAHQLILDKIAWANVLWGRRIVRRDILAFLVGKHPRTKGLLNAWSEMRTAGLIDYQDGGIVLTEAGAASARAPDIAPSLDGFLDAVSTILKGRQFTILKLAIRDGGISREDLAAEFELHPRTKSFLNDLSRVRSLGLVDYAGLGVVAADFLMNLRG